MRRALVVGVDDYPEAPLAGCVNDARAVEHLLARNHDGSPNFECRLLTSDGHQVDRATLLGEIEALFGAEADVALLYFAGHGTENDLGGYPSRSMPPGTTRVSRSAMCSLSPTTPGLTRWC